MSQHKPTHPPILLRVANGDFHCEASASPLTHVQYKATVTLSKENQREGENLPTGPPDIEQPESNPVLPRCSRELNYVTLLGGKAICFHMQPANKATLGLIGGYWVTITSRISTTDQLKRLAVGWATINPHFILDAIKRTSV